MAYAPGALEGFNFGLEPATSTQYEVGLKMRPDERTRINAAVFEIRTEDEIVVAASTDGRTSYRNAGKTLRRGFELSVQRELNPQWQANLAYTLPDATYDEAFTQGTTTIDKGNQLPGVPRSSLFGELVWKPRDGISMGLEGSTAARCTSRTPTTSTQHQVMRCSTGVRSSSSRSGRGPSTSWYAWTTCSTGNMWGR